MEKTTFTVSDDKKTLIVERTFNAPKSTVWRAYSDPEMLARWWGPRGWQTEIKHMDFSNGGYWHFGMKCVDPAQEEWYGKTSWGRASFSNIQPQDSFEYVDQFCDENGVVAPGMPVAKATLTLTEVGGGTKVTIVTEYDSAETLKQVLEMGMEEGFAETWQKLAEFLED